MNNFFAELKRRNVVRVAVAYAVVSWVILQFIDVLMEIVSFPDWFPQMVLVLLIIGIPIALIFSWAYEVTPEGVKKTHEVDQSDSITHGTGQRINKLIIGGLVLAVAFLLYDKFMINLDSPVIEDVQAAGTSIAVLPFVNLSSDKEQEYFSDGISEEILNVLVRVEGLSVTSRTSAFVYKGQDRNISQIAAELNVDHVLEGSVRRSGNTVRITAQLIDGKTDRHLWSETYDRELTDIFQIQDEISNAIVTALKETLGIEIAAPVSVGAATENMSAYDLFLKGRSLFISRADLPGSAELLEQAVALDDNFSAAWETLAATYSVMPSWGFSDRPYKALSDQAAEKAISLDSSLSLGYAVLGSNLGYDGLRDANPPDWKSSFYYMDKALENNPKNATAYLWRGLNYSFLGFFEKALEDINVCLQIDPAYGNCKRHKANTLVLLGRNKEAIDLLVEGTIDGFPVGAGSFTLTTALMDEGNEIAIAFYWRSLDGFETFPIREWLEAFKHPERDHRVGWNKLLKWGAEQEFDVASIAPSIAFVFGQYANITALPDYSQWLWWKEAHDFRQTEHFKRVVSERNYLVYWREFGFPPYCRAVGEDDYECD